MYHLRRVWYYLTDLWAVITATSAVLWPRQRCIICSEHFWTIRPWDQYCCNLTCEMRAEVFFHELAERIDKEINDEGGS